MTKGNVDQESERLPDASSPIPDAERRRLLKKLVAAASVVPIVVLLMDGAHNVAVGSP
jgi:hypothetical protein